MSKRKLKVQLPSLSINFLLLEYLPKILRDKICICILCIHRMSQNSCGSLNLIWGQILYNIHGNFRMLRLSMRRKKTVDQYLLAFR